MRQASCAVNRCSVSIFLMPGSVMTIGDWSTKPRTAIKKRSRKSDTTSVGTGRIDATTPPRPYNRLIFMPKKVRTGSAAGTIGRAIRRATVAIQATGVAAIAAFAAAARRTIHAGLIGAKTTAAISI